MFDELGVGDSGYMESNESDGTQGDGPRCMSFD